MQAVPRTTLWWTTSFRGSMVSSLGEEEVVEAAIILANIDGLQGITFMQNTSTTWFWFNSSLKMNKKETSHADTSGGIEQ